MRESRGDFFLRVDRDGNRPSGRMDELPMAALAAPLLDEARSLQATNQLAPRH